MDEELQYLRAFYEAVKWQDHIVHIQARDEAATYKGVRVPRAYIAEPDYSDESTQEKYL